MKRIKTVINIYFVSSEPKLNQLVKLEKGRFSFALLRIILNFVIIDLLEKYNAEQAKLETIEEFALYYAEHLIGCIDKINLLTEKFLNINIYKASHL